MKKPVDRFVARNAAVKKAVGAALGTLGVEDFGTAAGRMKRRAAPLRAALENRALTLVRDEARLLRWQIGTVAVPGPGQEAIERARARRGLRRAPLDAPPVLSQTLFDRLEPSKIGEWLQTADQKLTRPAWNERGQLWGLRRMTASGVLVAFGPDDMPKLAGKNVLLVIHGTFSNCDSVVKELASAPGGAALLSAAVGKYDFVLCFDHPTLGRSPVLNAFDLAAHFSAGVPASLDMVAHSRGGLVVRWFCEGFRHPSTTCRAILVGSPLAGTSIAAPARVKAVMDFLANAGDALSTATGFGGGIVLTLASTLAGFFARVAGALATPLADAIVALIPGLAAQAREGGNAELRALRINTGAFDFSDPASPVRYSSIASNFQPVESGVWGFLKSFVSRPGASLLDVAADHIFPGANDLVVDVESMGQTGEKAERPLLIPSAHDFGVSRTVHHCNYFQQRETARAIRSQFGF